MQLTTTFLNYNDINCNQPLFLYELTKNSSMELLLNRYKMLICIYINRDCEKDYMFRFARYFFIVFLVTTVIPLLLMFFWNHHRINQVIQEKEQHILDAGIKQLQFTSEQYLENKGIINTYKIQNIPANEISLKKIKDILDAQQVEWVYEKKNKLKSYYTVIKSDSFNKPNLYTVSIITYNYYSNRKIKVVQKVNFKEFHPAGPFDIKLYLGNKINKDNLLEIVTDPFFIPENGPRPNGRYNLNPMHHPDPMHMRPGNSSEDIFRNDLREHTKNYKSIKLTDNNGKPVATILLSQKAPPPGHFGPRNPIEDGFGLIILLAGSLLSLLTGFYINKNFISPLIILSNALKRIQKGDLTFKLHTYVKHDQILNTFNNFNQMIAELKEKDELRKSFITNLTHDLRTPLIAQERSLELISKEFESLGLKDEYELAKGIEKNNKHLLRMVNLILESYRFDSTNLKLATTDINISELINNCYENLRPLASEKNIQLVNSVSGDFPSIKGDSTCFNRIFINLISNAIENITHQGQIEIKADCSENTIKIFIEDNGPGIAPEDLIYIFDRYFTGKSDERKIGAGLGLHVCKKLVELHKGEILVESQVNSYTRFIIKLPVNKEEK